MTNLLEIQYIYFISMSIASKHVTRQIRRGKRMGNSFNPLTKVDSLYSNPIEDELMKLFDPFCHRVSICHFYHCHYHCSYDLNQHYIISMLLVALLSFSSLHC